MNKRIWLSSPHMGGDEIKFVHETFESNWIAPLGANVDNFEKDLGDYTGVKHVAVLTSGTAAIHLALIILGVRQGDEVICSSFTFSASANPIIYQGATPVFVDSESTTWNMDPQLLKTAIEARLKLGKKPKAIVIVHLYGNPAKLSEIEEIAAGFDIPVIEDAAEALGSEYKGAKLGSFGKIGILSFNGNKIITTSGGGALLSDSQEYVEKARFLATQARDDAPHYQHSHIGYNYRMSNVLAGIGRGQMIVLPERIRQRRYNFDYYKNKLSGLPGVSFLEEENGSFSNKWLTCMLVDPKLSGGITREDLRLYLWESQIESRPLWKPMHVQPVFEQYPRYVNGTSEKLFQDGLCLPSGSNLLDEDLERVTSGISELFMK